PLVHRPRRHRDRTDHGRTSAAPRAPVPPGALDAGPGSQPAFCTTRMTNDPGTMLGRGRGCSAVGEGGGPYFAVGRNIERVFSSRAIVRAPRSVSTVWTTSYLSPSAAFATVSVPPPF